MLDVDTEFMRKWWAVLIAVVVVAAAIAGSGVAEAAKPGKDRPPDAPSSSYGDTETLQTIENILSGAQTEMTNVAYEFVANVPSAQSQAEFDAMQSMALNEIEAVKKTAEVMLKDIRDSASIDEVFDAAQAAVQELHTSKTEFRSIVSSIEYMGPVATNTTTTTSPTSTTTRPHRRPPRRPPR